MALELFRFLTTTVGLVVARRDGGVNVMSAEWTYFVARDPLHVAVGINDGAYTQRLVEEAGEFSVTLCSVAQAALASFAGSFSGLEIDKSSSDLVDLVPPVATSTPRLSGGVFSAECPVVARLDLPGYKLFVGTALAVRLDDRAEPLVKHGGMYRLGERVRSQAIAAAAELLVDEDGLPWVRVAASLQGGRNACDPWHFSVVVPDGTRHVLGEVAGSDQASIIEDFPASHLWPDVTLPGCRVIVERAGTSAGTAAIAGGEGDRSTAARVNEPVRTSSVLVEERG